MTPNKAKIEIFRNGRWIPAADILVLGNDRCKVEYLVEYLFDRDATPIAIGMPLQMEADRMLPVVGGGLEEVDRRLPPFLFDLIPQGKGRKYLLGLLGLADADSMQLPLLLSGAFNPIGNLRIDTAVAFYEAHKDSGNTQAMAGLIDGQGGFSMQDIQQKSEAFLDHLSLHAMLAAGTTGVQGVAPKFLLTQNHEDRWFADLALADQHAKAHWLVKLPRGRDEADLMVLRNEAAYLRVADRCGLRVHHQPMLVGDKLFVRRFDREVGEAGLQRLHQESLASIVGQRGFGIPIEHNELLRAIRAHTTNPMAETIEYLKRDILNVAMRNTDNHARNTALQVCADGAVRLTPVYDFAPMFMDPEMVPRTVHWVFGGRREQDFSVIVERLELPAEEAALVQQALAEFAPVVARLPEISIECGVDARVLEQCRASIDRVATELSRIKPSPPATVSNEAPNGTTKQNRAAARRRPA